MPSYEYQSAIRHWKAIFSTLPTAYQRLESSGGEIRISDNRASLPLISRHADFALSVSLSPIDISRRKVHINSHNDSRLRVSQCADLTKLSHLLSLLGIQPQS